VKFAPAALALALLWGGPCRAQEPTAPPPQDPLEMMAGIMAFAEICAARYPDVADAPARLIQGAPAVDKAFLDQLLKSAAYQSALTKARIDVAQVPEEKMRVECLALQAPVPAQ